MKTSFRQTLQSGSPLTPAPEAPANAAPTALQPVSEAATALVEAPPTSGLTGEWGVRDIQIPRLSLVQKSGTLADEFPKGSYVFNKELVIADGQKSFELTVLQAKKYYQEDLPFGESEELPRIFERLEEARAAGFTNEWDTDKPRVKEAADLVVLVPVPLDYATLEFGGKGYTRALWTLISSAYNSAAKPIVTAAVCGHLRAGVFLGGWDVTSQLRSTQRHSWYVPVVRAKGHHAKPFAEFLKANAL